MTMAARIASDKMTGMLSILVASGIVARDFAWDTSGRKKALSKYYQLFLNILALSKIFSMNMIAMKLLKSKSLIYSQVLLLKMMRYITLVLLTLVES